MQHQTPQSNSHSKSDYLKLDMLRFTTAGSVDDGKSTLIGRLLYDSKSLYIDQIDTVKNTSNRKGEEHLNLAYFTDGLRAEQEQGITIDVAYRYFSTPKRKFIIADTPGHIQYTRNMVTGASTANLAIVIIDARKGVVEQSKRHTLIAALLGIPHIAVCINKMDLVDYSEDVYNQIVSDFRDFAAKIHVIDFHFIPISALHGDNVVTKSKNMKWYQGGTLMYLLENIHIANDNNFIDSRFNVQTVIRPQTTEYHDYRAYAGRMLSGVLRVGDRVKVLPSGFCSTIKAIHFGSDELTEASVPKSCSILLTDEIDISKGDLIVRENNLPKSSQDIEAMICWLGETPIKPGAKYILKHNCNEVKAIIKELKYQMDINSLSRITDATQLNMNDIGRIVLRTSKPLFYDGYKKNRITGSFIIIDESTNVTVGAGMILDNG